MTFYLSQSADRIAFSFKSIAKSYIYPAVVVNVEALLKLRY